MDNITNTEVSSKRSESLFPNELLELILSFFDMRDLLKAYCSCPHLHSLIRDSSVLRTNLFLQKPPTKQKRLEWDFVPKRHLLRDGDLGVPDFVPDESPIVYPVLLNPMLFRSSDMRQGVFWNNGQMLGVNRILHQHFELERTQAPRFGVVKPLTRKFSKDALCRRMYFTQPPVTMVEVCASIYELDWSSFINERRMYRIWNRDGVTLGDVLESLGDSMGNLNEIHFPGKLVVTVETLGAVENALYATEKVFSPAVAPNMLNEQQEENESEEMRLQPLNWRTLRQIALSSRR